ncbi:MAG: polysaccharide deacetylase family protein [Bacteroidota bacterium]|nr:polysaccharide deacetylase family protein [Bacteroidota bacterium]MDX5430916.1 polysaccharide deacetylase family protein [Bacteroidota bacterium]MDX5469663.1 polysaccharide deacetylase family protein [Bacteroidota bacterium]
MITIYSENKSPRLHYTLEVLFKRCLGLEFKLITDWEKFKKIDLPRINYSEREHKKCLRIVPHKLLFEEEIREISPKVKDWDGLPAFFQTDKKGTCPYDLFASSFYLVSRYEEYLDYKSDEHGRFPATESLAYKEGFLERPIVNDWAARLVELLSIDYPDYAFQHNDFRFISTIDVDMAYSYKHKGVWRNLGGFTRELLKLDLKKLDKRIKVLTDQEKDPFDNFDYQMALHDRLGIEVIYFVLLADQGKYDKNIDWDNEAFADLILELAEKYEVGIHPSYHSNKVKKKVGEELDRLQSITLQHVHSSRQHFLKLDIRETYKVLEHHGIIKDHSMGYSNVIGFRAGICSVYPYFDLLKNEQKELMLYPFAIMDVALNRFMKLSPQEAIERVRSLMQRVKKHKGMFISVFHNESLSDFDNWEGWREVYEAILMMAVNEDSIPA